MVELIIVGWVEGLNKVGLNHISQVDFGMEFPIARRTVNAILDGEKIFLAIDGVIRSAGPVAEQARRPDLDHGLLDHIGHVLDPFVQRSFGAGDWREVGSPRSSSSAVLSQERDGDQWATPQIGRQVHAETPLQG